ncbi:PqqD family protein [Reyranella sp.]|uniref:PqqD family protein n=1 Tax=Reyranella sp. TaxID=1929291 RepID=UPI003783FB8A
MTEYFSSVEKAPRIRCRAENEGHYLLYNPKTDQLHMLDELGKKVFDLCDGRTIDDVVKDACSLAVEGQPLVSPPDIVSFLCSLKKRHLVVMY